MEKQTALHRAAFYGNEKAINYLLDSTPLRVDQADIFGDTPVHLAARGFNITVLRKMVIFCNNLEKMGHLINSVNKKGESSLSITVGILQKMNRDMRF